MKIVYILVLSLLLTNQIFGQTASANTPISPQKYQAMLGKGMDVDWSKTRKGRDNYNDQTVPDFKKIGLSHVRIRIQDDVNEQLLRQLDRQIADCLKSGIIPVIAYQGDKFKNNPSDADLQKVVAWWKTVAERFKNVSPLVSFDLLIEVTDALNDNQPQLDKLYELAVTEIRKTNPTRIIFISPRVRSDPANLKDLKIPTKANGYLMAEWHFYASGPSKTNPKKLWITGTTAEKQIILDKIKAATDWSKSNGIPTWVGAWMAGDYNDGNNYSVEEQVVFARFVTCELTKAGIPFAVNSDTKFYDRQSNSWIQSMQPVIKEILNTNCGIVSNPQSTSVIPKGVNVGFNAKGTVDTTTQLKVVDQTFAKFPRETVKNWTIRITGGTRSQSDYPRDWSDATVKNWADLQKKYGFQYVYVVNGNDTPKSQYANILRWQKFGAKFAFIEMMNEYYLPKFKRGDTSVDEVTRAITPQSYVNEILPAFFKEIEKLRLPMFVILAPMKGETRQAEYYAEWNKTVVSALKTKFASKKLGVTIHLYQRSGETFDYSQIGKIRQTLPANTPIAITEAGATDYKSDPEKATATRQHFTAILKELKAGDYLLEQILYKGTIEGWEGSLIPSGMTEKGKAVFDLYLGN
jgi:hypothetical protein